MGPAPSTGMTYSEIPFAAYIQYRVPHGLLDDLTLGLGLVKSYIKATMKCTFIVPANEEQTPHKNEPNTHSTYNLVPVLSVDSTNNTTKQQHHVEQQEQQQQPRARSSWDWESKNFLYSYASWDCVFIHSIAAFQTRPTCGASHNATHNTTTALFLLLSRLLSCMDTSTRQSILWFQRNGVTIADISNRAVV